MDVLRRDFRYTKSRKPRNLDPERTEKGLKAAVANAIEDASGKQANALVVHVLTHGERKLERLFIYAGDRERATVDVEQWLSSAANINQAARPHALFILDCCYAGYATRSPFAIGPVGERRVWIIAATGAEDYAFDGRFTRAVTKVLRDYKSKDLTVDESSPYIPFKTLVKDIERELNSMYGNDFLQEIETSYLQAKDEVPELPFFINPRRRARGDSLIRAKLVPEAQPLIDTVPFESDKILNYVNDSALPGSASTISVVSSGNSFVGRSAELRKLSDWLDDEVGSPIRVVTGKPGVGKSALLGIVVCAAHPRLRQATAPLWRGLDPVPTPQGDRFCAVHARGREISDIVDGLSRQLGLGLTGRADRFIQQVASLSGKRPVIVIDAIDEAADADGLVKALLHPLATKRRRNETPACRLLIGSRREDWLSSLIQADDGECLIDLGQTSREALHADISKYMDDALQLSGPYAGAQQLKTQIRKELVEAAADALTGADGCGGTPDFGEFLVAGLFARQLRQSRPVRSPQAARALGATIPRTLSEVLDLDLARGQSLWLRPLLAAVAHAYGDGMPDQLIRKAMGVMKWGRSDRPGPTTKELHQALDAAEFYLRRSVDSDGRTLYRIFHQGLTDRLRSEPLPPGAS